MADNIVKCAIEEWDVNDLKREHNSKMKQLADEFGGNHAGMGKD